MAVLVYCKKAAFLCSPLVEEYAVDVGVFEFVGPFGVVGIAYYGCDDFHDDILCYGQRCGARMRSAALECC